MAITDWEIRRAPVEKGGIKIILCDDDPVFLGDLQLETERVFRKMNMEVSISPFRSPICISPEMLARCDMAFLDIDFDGEDCNGIDIARKLRKLNSHGLIFFVTNFIDYAPAGYEVQAFRYILKRDMGQVLERYMMQAMEALAAEQEFLRLLNRDEIINIPLGRISYLEVMDHSVSVHSGDRVYELNSTLTSLEEGLNPHGFLRIHKSYLVNMAHIRKFRSRECLLADGTTLAVSEKNYSQQKQKYLLWKGLK